MSEMKTNRLYILIILVALISCEINNNDNNKSSVYLYPSGEIQIPYKENTSTFTELRDESFSKWTEFKEKNGNSYMYQTSRSSWTGSSSKTEFKIINGVVISRRYEAFRPSGTYVERRKVYSYSETKDDLGTNTRGGKPLTLDELYHSCADEYLIVDKSKNTLYFKTNQDGLMTLCGFVPRTCADDCFRGVRIDSIRRLD